MKRLVACLQFLSLSGCGTIMNFGAGTCPITSYPHVYGGVIFEVGEGIWVSPLNFILPLLDLPFTLVADTVTLPVTIITTVTYEERPSIEKPKSKQAVSR